MKLEQKLALQSDDTVTAATNEVPVIKSKSWNLHDELTMAVNFLRLGCPAVQILYPYTNKDGELQKTLRLLKHLAFGKEEFETKTEDRSAISPDALWIITITRTV